MESTPAKSCVSSFSVSENSMDTSSQMTPREAVPLAQQNATKGELETKAETLTEIALRILCDLQLFSVTNVFFSLLFLLVHGIIFMAAPSYESGTAIYSENNFNFEMASVEFVSLANVPLSLTFLSVLMKLDPRKRKISLFGM